MNNNSFSNLMFLILVMKRYFYFEKITSIFLLSLFELLKEKKSEFKKKKEKTYFYIV